MPRSAADATRFTATGPQAYSKPATASSQSPPISRLRLQNDSARATTVDPKFGSSTASTIDLPTSHAPPNETPLQKVNRLRDAARRVREQQDSTFDKVVRRGRVWADRAHRVTVLGLMGLSVCCTGLAIYATVDMIVYNRRKRRTFLAEQHANYNVALQKAYAAEAAGTLTPDLALVLNKERAIQQYEAELAQKQGLVQGAKEWLFGGMSKSERPGGAMGFASEEIKRIARGGEAEGGEAESGSGAVQRLEEAAREKGEIGLAKGVEEFRKEFDHSEGHVMGRGMLDELGDRTARDVQATTSSLWDRIRGR